VLVRGAPPEDHRVKGLRLRPERRVVHAVRLPEAGWVANVHAQVRPHTAARADLRRAGEVLDRWAGADAPVLLGGDCNVADPRVHGLVDLGGHGIDRLLGRGWRATAPARTLERHGLSDHAPVAFEVERG
jgi:endonuclease/exonuclease/phosphatase (EEP) superfamily protein YafD